MPNRPLSSPIRPHGFAGERHVVLAGPDVVRATRRPVLRDLLVTAAGHFPRAAGHLVHRPCGLAENILIFCREGQGWCRLGTRRWRLRAGQSVVIPRRTAHAYGADRREPWSIYWAHFSGGQAAARLAFVGLTAQEPLLTCARPGEIAQHFEELLDLLRVGTAPANLFALSATFTQILSLLNVYRVADRVGAATAMEKVRGTVDFLRQHLAQRLPVASLARLAGLSVPHYTTLFRRAFGCPPLAYALRLKVQEAGQRLATSDARVSDIARGLGFDDALYFSRLFHRVAGCSPRDYRAHHRPGAPDSPLDISARPP